MPRSTLRLAPTVASLLIGCGGGAGRLPEGDAGDSPPGEAPFVQHVLWTEHLGPLVGTARAPLAPVGLAGTDLGVAVPIDGELAFLFGDSWTLDGADWDVDSVAMAPATLPADGSLPPLRWMTRPSGRFLPLAVPGVALGGMNVPVDGFTAGDLTYVFFTTGYDAATGVHSHSVLAHTRGRDLGGLVVDHVVATPTFLDVAAVVDGDDVWLFASGAYRKSAVYLARAPLATVADRSTWSYYRGGVGEQAGFAEDEAAARPIVDETSVGELSVRRHPRRALWLMTYNAASPRGIHLRTAPTPLGPWSEPTIIWEPSQGYGSFMHQARDAVGFDDGLGEPGRDDVWGGEYGPYLVPAWFDGPGTPDGTVSIVYTLSSWNPYTVHLVRTVLGDPATGAQPPVRGADLPPARITNGDFADGTLTGWSGSGDPFAVFTGDDGSRRVTTFTEAKGDAAIGRLWQDVAVDAGTRELRFRVHGGHAAVKLVHDGEVVRTTRGLDQNQPDLEVRWSLAAYRGDTVRIVIDDDVTGPWGFIGATDFELR